MREKMLQTYLKAMTPGDMRYLAQNDLFYLLCFLLNRPDVNNDFCYERCLEFQANPDGHLDLWAREHYKSTIITFAGTIQEILKDPEITVGIFSQTRTIAKAFLRQVKRELEDNELLKNLFPDVLYANPWREAPQWSEENGLIVKRRGNPKESTLEAWGMVDSQPTGRHFSLRIYDDVVTPESVSTPDMIKKTTSAWEVSLNLGTRSGRERYIGTRYHANDTYATIMEREAAIPRIYAATKDGTATGEPIFLTSEELARKRKSMGEYTFSCQMLQNPVADNAQGFKEQWVRQWDGIPSAGETDAFGILRRDHTTHMNKYILVDPASAKKKDSDYTVMLVVGLAFDQNYYVIDGIRDRLNLTEKAKKLLDFHRKYRPLAVGYEQYGMQADIEYIQVLQDQINYRFDITPLGGKVSKDDRIRWLVPIFEQGRMFWPRQLIYTDYTGMPIDLVKAFFKEEYAFFPVSKHDDILDCLSRIADPAMAVQFPENDPEALGNTVDFMGYVSSFQQRQKGTVLSKWRTLPSR